MMTGANLPTEHRFTNVERAANWAVKLAWLTIVEINGVSKARFEHYEHKIPSWTKQMQNFGEAGTVKIRKKGKVCNRGMTMMYVGHAGGHTGDVHRTWNQNANKYSETRDVIWLNCMYFEETVKNYDVELNYDKDEEFWVNSNNTPEERRDDDKSDNESVSSSVADGNTNDERWVRYTTRAGKKIGLPSGPFDPITGSAKSYHDTACENIISPCTKSWTTGRLKTNGTLITPRLSNWGQESELAEGLKTQTDSSQ